MEILPYNLQFGLDCIKNACSKIKTFQSSTIYSDLIEFEVILKNNINAKIQLDRNTSQIFLFSSNGKKHHRGYLLFSHEELKTCETKNFIFDEGLFESINFNVPLFLTFGQKETIIRNDFESITLYYLFYEINFIELHTTNNFFNEQNSEFKNNFKCKLIKNLFKFIHFKINQIFNIDENKFMNHKKRGNNPKVYIDELVNMYPNIVENIKLQDQKYFIYNEGFWQEVYVDTIQKLLSKNLIEKLNLNQDEQNFVNNNIEALMKKFIWEIRDYKFNLNSNPNVFEILNENNEILDLIEKKFRPPKPEDSLFFFNNWIYSRLESFKYRSELNLFFENLFKNAEEYECFMHWFCETLFNSFKTETHRKIMILASNDYNISSSGSQFLMQLISSFYGPLRAIEGLKYISKSSAIPNRNSHETAVKKLNYVKLLLVYKTKKSIEIDETFIMSILQNNITKNVRSIYCKNECKFNSLVNLIIQSNDNNFPKFDIGDEIFTNLMLVLKMENIFTDKIPQKNNNNYKTCLVPKNIELYKSSFLDCVLEFKIKYNHLKKLPPLIQTKKYQFILNSKKDDSYNFFLDWKNKHLQFCENLKSCITVRDLKKLLKETKLKKICSGNNSNQKIKILLQSVNIEIISRFRWYENKIQKEKCNILKNINFKS